MGPTSFLRPQNKKPIESLIASLSRKYGITVYQRAIATNHLHILLRIECRKSYVAFIRVLSSLNPNLLQSTSTRPTSRETGPLQKKFLLRGDGKNTLEIQGKGQKFWQFRPFNRVLFWGRDFKTCRLHVIQNTLEAIGFLAYKPRHYFYAKWIEESLGSSTA
jgi:REP element-mobilizing transposase RayT